MNSFKIVNQEKVKGLTTAEQSLHNGGWNCAASFRESEKGQLIRTACGTYLSDARGVIVSRLPVSDYGVYRLELTVYAERGDIRNMAVFSGRRTSVARNVTVPKGESWKKVWYAVTAPYIPAFSAKTDRERALYVSVTGENAGISRLTAEAAAGPVLWVAGDSTVTDQNALFPYYAGRSCGGWAQALPRYLDGMAVCNYAHSGMTTNCFRDDGHWALIQKYARAGDAVLFQFGHNDQKRRNLSAFGGYSDNLRRYVREARELQLQPILVSPISRIPFEDRGEMRSLLSLHALAVEKLAQELQVPFINLHELTFERWVAAGKAAADSFMPGDATHTNDYGADDIAALVAAEIRRKKIEPICSHLLVQPEAFCREQNEKLPPPEPQTASIFDIDLPYVDAGRGACRKRIEKAFRAGLLDPCVLHVHPKESLPRGQLLMLFFKAIRRGGVRPYLGAFDDLSRYEWDSGYVQACINDAFIEPEEDAVFATLPAGAQAAVRAGGRLLPAHFYPDQPVTAGFLALLSVRALEKDKGKRLSLSLAECMEKARALSLLAPDLASGRVLKRVDCYAALAELSSCIASGEKALSSDHPLV